MSSSTTSSAARVRFQGGGEFSRVLNERAQVVLADAATMRRAYRILWAKSALVLAWAVASYLYLLLVASTPLAVVAGSLSLGLAAAGIGFCIMHDANHGGYSPSRTVNRVAAHSLDLIGGSSYVWAAKHLAHHTYTNVVDHDPDIDALPFARFEPTQKRRGWHRYQHVYLWVLYAFVTLRWQVITDFTFLARGAVGRSVFRRPRGWDLAGLAFGKVFFIVWAIAIPLTQHPLIELIPVLLTVSAVASLALTVTFQLSHCLEEAITLAPVESSAKAEWHIHQVEATADFAQRNPLLRWYLGGLNHQIEHHLFPRVPHTLHAQLARIVSSTAVEYGVTYNAHPSVKSALRSHTRWLKQMGAAPVV
jgi:linoleoyl-CoA desaturase